MQSIKRYVQPTIHYPLYKFTKREFAEEFFRSGRLRLGTIYEYRIQENYGHGIFDDNEGYASFSYRVADRLRVSELKLATNNWIFCCSERFDPRFFDEFNADCCFVINSIGFFDAIDKKLRSECKPLLLRRVRYKSPYFDDIQGRDFAGVIKGGRFSHQREIRACWEPKVIPPPIRLANPPLVGSIDSWMQHYSASFAKKENDRVAPRFIDVPKARAFCSNEVISK